MCTWSDQWKSATDIFCFRNPRGARPKLPSVGHRCAVGLLQEVRLVRTRKRLGGICATLLLGYMSTACELQRRDRFYLPKNFNQLAHVRFGVGSAPPLEMEDGFRVVHIPNSGEFSTSSPMRPGEGYRDEYICLDGSSRRHVARRGWTSADRNGIWEWTFQVDCNSWW